LRSAREAAVKSRPEYFTVPPTGVCRPTICRSSVLFAATAAADDEEDLRALHGKRHLVQHDAVAVGAHQVGDLDGRERVGGSGVHAGFTSQGC